MLGISDEPASAPGEITADQEADAATPAAVAPEPDMPPDAPGFTWEDAESDTGLPKPLKAPPLKNGRAKPKRPRGKKPESE